MPDLKPVSVIIPVFNEERSILPCLESLLDGDYAGTHLEFVIADGGSEDRTLKKVEDFSRSHPEVRIKVVHNPYRTQGHGLNLAIEKADHLSEIILRADAHAIYPKNYIADCVKTLREVDADNVGGVMVPVSVTPVQKAVAFCMSHPLGVGDARFHLGNYSGFVDTVYLGCFRRSVFERAGLFDPVMTPNEDAELNLRIRQCGGRVYLNGDIRVKYCPRDSLLKLMAQYFRYGQGRCRSFRKHGRLTSVRQILPPLLVVITLISLGMMLLSKLSLIPLALYLSLLILASAAGAVKKQEISLLISPLCFVIMHYAWGAGFLRACLTRQP